MKKFWGILLFVLSVLPLNAQRYRQSFDVAGGIGLSRYTKYGIAVSYQGGIQVKVFYAGLGVGFRYADALYYTTYVGGEYYESRDGKYLIPLNLRLKCNFTKTTVSPFLLLDLGYTFDVGKNPNKNIEGFFLEPLIGLDIKFKDGNMMNIGLGINIQNQHYKSYINYPPEEYKYMVGCLQLHVGMSF